MWRVEFNACGWSSCWIVVRGYYDEREILRHESGPLAGFMRDFGSEESAVAACAEANAKEVTPCA